MWKRVSPTQKTHDLKHQSPRFQHQTHPPSDPSGPQVDPYLTFDLNMENLL